MCSQATADRLMDDARPGLPDAIVDAHHHLWRLGGDLSYPWLQAAYDAEHFMLGPYDVLRRDFGVQEFRRAACGAPIVASVHVEAECARADALAETRWLHEVAARHGLPSAVVAWVDLLADDAGERIAEQARYPLVRAVRFKPLTSALPAQRIRGPGTLNDPRWPRALERLRSHGLGWDLRVPFWHLEEAAARLADAPALDVMLEHAGLPWDRTEGGLARWRRGMAALAAHPRVSVKLSEFGLRNSAWNETENRRIIRDTIETFGVERCMFASNFPVAGLRIAYPALVSTFAAALADMGLDECARRAVWHDNAARIYRLDLNPPRHASAASAP